MKRVVVVGFVLGLLAASCAKEPTPRGAVTTPRTSTPSPSWSSASPVPRPSSPSPSPQPKRPRTYTVEAGDTLSSIGHAFGVPWQDIVALNSIAAPYVIVPGQVLRIPRPGQPVPPPPSPSPTGGLPASLVGSEWYRLPTSSK